MRQFLLCFFILGLITCFKVHSEVISKEISIAKLIVHGNGAFMIYSSEKLGGNCYKNDTLAKVYFHSTDMTQEGLDRSLSVVLLAKSTGKKLILFFDDSTRNCLVKQIGIQE